MPDLSDLIVKQIPDAADMCFGIVVAEKKADITEALLRGAVETLEANGALSENIHVKTVPSISDLVYGAHQMSLRGYYDAVMVIGCIIRGDTPYFDYVCQGLSYGISKLNTTSEVPIIYGVLTTDTAEQAYQRSDGTALNAGSECAVDAIKMAKF